MYEVYYYPPEDGASVAFNIRDTSDNTTTGCKPSLADACFSVWRSNKDKLSIRAFEQRYHCRLLFLVDSLDALPKHYPEYLI